MSDAVKEFRAHLARMPIVAILRGIRPDEAEGVGRALVAAGVTIIEVPSNSPEPFDSIRSLAHSLGAAAMVGAGTVLSGAQAQMTRAAGGRLVVSPNLDAAVVRETKRLGMVSAPGFFSPTEAFAAVEAGADALKLFPADAVGPGFVRALKAVLPKPVPILAVGGVGADNMDAYLAAGAAGFGIGSSLYAPGMEAAEVFARASRLVKAVRPEA